MSLEQGAWQRRAAERVEEPAGDVLSPPSVRPVQPLGRVRRWAGLLVPLLIVVFAATALYVLDRELARYGYAAIAAAFRTIPDNRRWLAAVFTVLCYAILFWYDWLALRYAGHPLKFLPTAFTSFVAYTMSQSLGLSALTGASIRFRYWSAWGLTSGEIARGVAFTTVTFWLGALGVGGVATLLAARHSRQGTLWALLPPYLAVVLLLPIALYLLWVIRRGPPLKIGRLTLERPSPTQAIGQIVVASLDWTLAGLVLFVLLPQAPSLTPAIALSAFLVAQIAGLVSHVPGGIGVFESAMLVTLSKYAPIPAIAAGLIAYRLVYYLFPLAAGLSTLAGYELFRQRVALQRAGRALGRVVPAAAPYWLSGAIFVAGVVLLVSGSTPSVHARLRWLIAFLPLAVIEVSHFAASVIGVVLLLVANGVRRRLDAAWHIAVALLALGVLTSLLKGGDWEEGLLLSVVLVALLPARRHFYRRAALIGEPLSRGWLGAVLLAVMGSIWLGYFSYQHVDYSTDLWWHFALAADAPRFLRATVGVAVALVVFATLRLLRPMRHTTPLPSREELAAVREIIANSSRSEANLALLGDKALLFSSSRHGFLMYGVHQSAWVALGDPVASPAESRELAWRFCELADQHGGRPAFYEVGSDLLPLYVDLGLALIKLGEEARVPLADFDVDAIGRKGLRRVLREGLRSGLDMEIVYPPLPAVLWEELAAVSDAWLAQKHAREKRFSLGCFDPDYLENFPIALVREAGRLVAFANIWTSGYKEELSVDLMRHLPNGSRYVMDFLFVRLMQWGREQGFNWFNLGMAPLSGIEGHPLAPLWSRLGAVVYRYGEHFYNFKGLRQYKEKFDPVWRPRYLAWAGGWSLPVLAASIAALIAGGWRGIVTR